MANVLHLWTKFKAELTNNAQRDIPTKNAKKKTSMICKLKNGKISEPA